MKSRHKAREVALQILYRYDSAATTGATPGPSDPRLLAEDLSKHFDHFQVPAELREFAAELVAGTLSKLPEIDKTLEKHTSNWKVSRMATVDRCVLRMAVFEMIRFPEIPQSVTMDEAIELAKQFGTSDTPSFVNGILDAVAREISAGSQKN